MPLRKGAGNLRNNKRDNFAFIKTGEQPECDGYRGIQVCTRNACGQIDSHCYPQTPDDTDFPLTKSSTSYFECSDTAHTEENQQPGTEEFSNALAF